MDEGIAGPTPVPVPVPAAVGLGFEVLLYDRHLVMVVGAMVWRGQLHLPVVVPVAVRIVSAGQKHVGVLVTRKACYSLPASLPIFTHLWTLQ